MNLSGLVATAPEPSSDWRATLLRGYGLLVFCVASVAIWAGFARIDAAVIAQGHIAVATNTKTIQHLEGGIVREILVRSGQEVEEGQVLVRLDPTRNRAGEVFLRTQFAIDKALEARLLAQYEEREAVAFPSEVIAAKNDPTVASAMADNLKHFQSRRAAWISADKVINEQIEQAHRDGEAARSALVTAEQQVASIDTELPPLQRLQKRGLVPLPRVTALERERHEYAGDAEKAKIDIARSAEKIAELTAGRDQLRQEYKEEAAEELTDVRKALNEIQRNLTITEDALRRIDVVAPVKGTIQNVKIFTIGGVVKPGEALLDIVPSSDKLVVTGEVRPGDIDRIQTDMKAELRLPQFQRYHSQVIYGKVSWVSRDTIPNEVDPRIELFDMGVEVDRDTVPKVIADKLVAGMNVEIIVPTEARTVLEYLLSPILNRLALSLRER